MTNVFASFDNSVVVNQDSEDSGDASNKRYLGDNLNKKDPTTHIIAAAIDCFTPLKKHITENVIFTLLQISKCIIHTRIASNFSQPHQIIHAGQANQSSKNMNASPKMAANQKDQLAQNSKHIDEYCSQYQELWPVFSALELSGNSYHSCNDFHHPIQTLLMLCETLWLSECSHCGRARSDFSTNSDHQLSCCNARRFFVYPLAYSLFLELPSSPFDFLKYGYFYPVDNDEFSKSMTLKPDKSPGQTPLGMDHGTEKPNAISGNGKSRLFGTDYAKNINFSSFMKTISSNVDMDQSLLNVFYSSLVLEFATQIVLMQADLMGPSGISIAANRYLHPSLLKDCLDNDSYSSYSQLVSTRLKEMVTLAKQFGSSEQDTHSTFFENIRKKYPIDVFEKALAYFCISLICNIPLPELRMENLEFSDIQNSLFGTNHPELTETNKRIISLSWLKERAGGSENFQKIAFCENPIIERWISTACLNSSIIAKDNIQESSRKTKGKIVNKERYNLKQNVYPTASTDEELSAQESTAQNLLQNDLCNENIQKSNTTKQKKRSTIQDKYRSEKKSMMDRQNSATKCTWENSQENQARNHLNILQESNHQRKISENDQIVNTYANIDNGYIKETSPVKFISKRNIEPVIGSRKKRFFSEEEISYLVEGYEKYGPRWTMILDLYPFKGRSSVDLKDKIRNLKKSGLLTVSEKELPS